MTQVRFANVKSEPLLAPVELRPRKRRLDRVVREWTRDLGVPFVVSVHRPGEVLTPSNDNVRSRAVPKGLAPEERAEWEARLWRNTTVARNDIVLITILPQGGGGGGGAGKIALTIASIALMAFAGPLAGMLLKGTALAGNTFAIAALQAGITIGGAAILMAFARRNQDNRQVYGVSGGGNLPRPNDRIPVGYGTFWAQPDLTQPDYFRAVEETSMILFKRMCIGLGKYRLKEIRVNGTTMWTGDAAANSGVITSGMTAPFPGCRIELLNGQASTLVPSSVITSPSVTGNIIPLSDNPNPILGPFAVNPVGTQITKVQVDISCSSYHHNGHQSWRDLWIEYAPINDAGTPIGAWQTLHRSTGDVFITKTLRWTYMVDVPAGRYAVRARNNTPKPEGQYNMDFVWDALRGYVPDTIVRAGMTEIAMEIKAGEGLNQTSFADVQVKVQRWGLVYDQSTGTWVEGPIGKCVDIFVDMLRDASYGGAVPTDLIDVSKVVAYRNALTQFDTFDGVIRGPVTLWDAMTQVLSNMRAEPVRIGAGYTFIRDEPSAIKRHVFSRSQIVRDTVVIEEAPKANEGEAHVVIEFSPDSDPKRKETATAYYGQESMTPRRIQWPGVSSYEHAMHLARWFAASGYYRRTTITFDTELAGRIPLRGQPILVDPWFVEARKVSAAVGLSGTTLTLDSDIEVVANDRVILRTQRGREWGPVRVTQGANLREIVLNASDVAAEAGATGIPLADVIAPLTSILTSVIVGQLADIGTVWLMSSMEPGEDGRTSITAKIDAAEVYAAINEDIPPVSPLTWALVPVEAPTVEVLTAQAVQHTSSLVVQWAARAQVGAVRYEVQIAYATDTDAWEQIYVGPSPTGEAPIRYLSTGEPVYLRVRAFGSTGLTGGWIQTSMVTPKPVVMATGAEAGAINWAANDPAVQNAFQALSDRLAAMQAQMNEFASVQAAIDDARARGAEYAERRFVSEGRGRAEIRQQVVALADDAQSLTIQMTEAKSVIEENSASIVELETTKVDDAGATAAAQTLLNAVFGAGSAGVKWRLGALATPGGYAGLFEIQVSVTGADGSFHPTGLQIASIYDGPNIISRIEFSAGQVIYRHPTTGEILMGWDAASGAIDMRNMRLYASVWRDQAGVNWRGELTGKYIRFRDTGGVERIFLGIRDI